MLEVAGPRVGDTKFVKGANNSTFIWLVSCGGGIELATPEQLGGRRSAERFKRRSPGRERIWRIISLLFFLVFFIKCYQQTDIRLKYFGRNLRPSFLGETGPITTFVRLCGFLIPFHFVNRIRPLSGFGITILMTLLLFDMVRVIIIIVSEVN